MKQVFMVHMNRTFRTALRKTDKIIKHAGTKDGSSARTISGQKSRLRVLEINRIMDKANDYLIKVLTKDLELTREQRDVVSYGLEAFLYTVISTAVLILYGMIWGQVKATIIIIGVFYTNQTIGGGFHAKSHMKCIITMLIGLSFAVIILRISYIPPIAYRIIGFFGCMLLLFFPLVLHKKKRYLEPRRYYLKRRSIIVTIIETVMVAITAFYDIALCNTALMGLFLSGISRFAGNTINRMDTD